MDRRSRPGCSLNARTTYNITTEIGRGSATSTADMGKSGATASPTTGARAAVATVAPVRATAEAGHGRRPPDPRRRSPVRLSRVSPQRPTLPRNASVLDVTHVEHCHDPTYRVASLSQRLFVHVIHALSAPHVRRPNGSPRAAGAGARGANTGSRPAAAGQRPLL